MSSGGSTSTSAGQQSEIDLGSILADLLIVTGSIGMRARRLI